MQDLTAVISALKSADHSSLAAILEKLQERQQTTDLDGYTVTDEVTDLFKWTPQWLMRKVKDGSFPPPDVWGGPGRAHRWRRSTINRALDEMQSASKAAR